MADFNEIYFKGVDYQFVSTDEWDCIQQAAFRRARTERSQVLFDLVRWIIKRMRRASGHAARIARLASRRQVSRQTLVCVPNR